MYAFAAALCREACELQDLFLMEFILQDNFLYFLKKAEPLHISQLCFDFLWIQGAPSAAGFPVVWRHILAICHKSLYFPYTFLSVRRFSVSLCKVSPYLGFYSGVIVTKWLYWEVSGDDSLEVCQVDVPQVKGLSVYLSFQTFVQGLGKMWMPSFLLHLCIWKETWSLTMYFALIPCYLKHMTVIQLKTLW